MTKHISTKVVDEQHYMTVSQVPAVKETASWSTEAATCSSPLLSQQWCCMTMHLSIKVVVEQHYMTVSQVPAVNETALSIEFDKLK